MLKRKIFKKSILLMLSVISSLYFIGATIVYFVEKNDIIIVEIYSPDGQYKIETYWNNPKLFDDTVESYLINTKTKEKRIIYSEANQRQTKTIWLNNNDFIINRIKLNIYSEYIPR